MSDESPVVIGWNEYIDLPDWDIRGLRAKIDTGARTSAIHVENVEEISRGRVRFDVVLHRKVRDRRVHVTAKVVRRARVRSSTGHYTTRYFVSTRMVLAGVEREIELSLVDREKMIFRMLLGRSALTAPFMIAASHRMVHGRPSSKKKKKKAKKSRARKETKSREAGGTGRKLVKKRRKKRRASHPERRD